MTKLRPATRAWGAAALAAVVVVAAVIGIVTERSAPTVQAVVATWTPNHAKYCASVIGLSELWQGSIHKPVTARWELTYMEDSAVYAPTRLAHEQLGPVAVAFAPLLEDPSGLRLFTRHSEWPPPFRASTDSRVITFYRSLAPYDTTTATPLSEALRNCGELPPGVTQHDVLALGPAQTAYYVNVASGFGAAATIAQYRAYMAAGIGESVVAHGRYAEFTFSRGPFDPTGPAVCVTRPAVGEPPPSVVSC